jgi:hypothetical protein
MGHKLYIRMKNNEMHQDGFGVLFFILWIFNIVCFIIIVNMVTEEFSQEDFARLFGRPIEDILMLVSSYLFIFTGIFTLLLDVPIDRKVKKQFDASVGLLQDYDH